MLKTIAVVCLLLAAAAVVVNTRYLGPYGDKEADTFIEVEHGMNAQAIANALAKEGVIRSPWVFMVVRAVHPRAALQAGEYRFRTAETPWQIFDKIRKGEVFFEDLTIPEGSNIFDIATILREGDTVAPDDFLKATADVTLIHDLDPQAPTLEGYLFPSTYRVTHKTTAQQLCRAMVAEFRKRWRSLSQEQPGIQTHRIVTLASLVEKETAVASERPVVAAVYNNRLSSGMLLQCDPTTVYAAILENRYRGVIHKSDLASTNPYNTYLHAGLPPGPIANPGLSSLRGALHPAETPFLYFVARADGSGAHHFSTTLAEHMVAVSALRRSGR